MTMTETGLPRILLIDDRNEYLGTVANALRDSVEIITRAPGDVWYDTLSGLDVILIDWLLEDWPARRGVSPTMYPADGVAVAAVLQSVFRHQGQLGGQSNQPLIVLWTGELTALREGLPEGSPAHIVARRHAVDWVFSKDEIIDDAGATTNRLLSLAAARAALRAVAGPPKEIAQQLLNLASVPKSSRQRALDDVEAAFPPSEQQFESTSGLGFLKWLLHRILPYPCFLSDEIHLATRLGCTVESFRKSHEANTKFTHWLDDTRYQGVLDSFLGPRWWRAAFELTLWEQTKGQPFNTPRILEVLNSDFEAKLEPLAIELPVVCLDATLNYSPTPYAFGETIRVQPGDWPPYAEEARVSLETAKANDFIRSLIHWDETHLVDA